MATPLVESVLVLALAARPSVKFCRESALLSTLLSLALVPRFLGLTHPSDWSIDSCFALLWTCPIFDL